MARKLLLHRTLAPLLLAVEFAAAGAVPAAAVSVPATEKPAEAAPAGWFGNARPLQIPPFVKEFAGVDLSSLTPASLERFIHRANTEYCTCGQSGCPRHTLAFCHKVDPDCPRALAMLKSLADEAKGAQAPPAAEPAPSPPAAPPSPPKF